MKQFIFNKKDKVRKDGTVKKGCTYTIKTDDDCIVHLRKVNLLRHAMGKLPRLKEGEGQDFLDVSGAKANSPSMIVWNGTDFVAVPYDERHDRFLYREKIKDHRKELEGSIQVNELAELYRIPIRIVISVCQKSGLGEKQEDDPLTKEEVGLISQRLHEIGESFGNGQPNEGGAAVRVIDPTGTFQTTHWV